MNRDIGLKPREEGILPPEKLREILGQIYSSDAADVIFERLMTDEEEKSE